VIPNFPRRSGHLPLAEVACAADDVRRNLDLTFIAH
jgi:hypothetical protein